MKFNLGHIILLGTLLISIPRYAAAFSQAEPTFLGLTIAPVTGLGTAILLEVGVYFVINAWFAANRRGLKWNWLLLAGFVVQLVIGPFIIAPAIVGHMLANPGELSGVLETRVMLWIWAIVVAAAPALLLAAATAASFMQQPVTTRKQAEPDRKEPEIKPETTTTFPAWLPVVPESKAHFVELVRSGAVTLPEGVTGEDLIPVAGTDRTGRAWLKAAKEARNGTGENHAQ
jgi:hypothetical protein